MVQRAPSCSAVLGGIKVGCQPSCWVRFGGLGSVGGALGACAGRVRHVAASGVATHPEGRSKRAGGGVVAGVLPCGWGQVTRKGMLQVLCGKCMHNNKANRREQGRLSWAGSTAVKSWWVVCLCVQMPKGVLCSSCGM